VGALVDRFRSPLSTPMPVQLNGGRPFHIHARFNWPVWTSLAEAVSQSPSSASTASDACAQGPATEAAAKPGLPAGTGQAAGARNERIGSGLAHLRTGDEQVASVIDKIRRVLDRDIPILVLGETGTGKELLARAIHCDSARAKQPFVAVNCASIPDTLIEAELFGYEDGAFTGARRKGQVGKIVQANGGTLFLDEIGDMPLGLQAHLLRVLQERQVTPLGSTKSVAVDVSIICATHRNLREMIEAKQFREDLFYRLNGLAVRLPALRERSDLMTLVQRILDRENPNRRLRPSADVVKLFEHYHWPGNVRQLFNVLRTASVMAAGEPVITREHLSDDFLEDASLRLPTQEQAAAQPVAAVPMSTPMAAPSPSAAATPAAPATTHAAPVAEASLPQPSALGSSPRAAAPAAPAGLHGRSLEELEIEAIRHAVDAAGGNISEASKRLGVSRNTIYRKLRWNQPK
jgi:transcriptional regulator with PAS, ATPase and Fis domain